jgi:hypothetical protein
MMVPGNLTPKSLCDWIAGVSAANTEANAAAQHATWNPPPRWDVRTQDGGETYGEVPFASAVQLSRNGLAIGYLPHTAVGDMMFFGHRAGAPYAVADHAAVWVVMAAKNKLPGRSDWDDYFYVWETMDSWNRDFLLGLHWSPMDPMNPMEALASAAD